MTGLLLIDKPAGKTSYGAVAAVKHCTHEKRVGHTGTLDPMATGVLPVLIGKATALSSYLSNGDKRYTARVRLGVTTDTCDITGKISAENRVSVSPEQLDSCIRQFTGKLTQIPPLFSALKKDGVPLYKLARRGETAEIPSREITVYNLKLRSPLDENNEFELDAFVSKGTYIRSLARDMGEFLGCGATLTALRRTVTCGFDITQCVPLEQLSSENIGTHILPAEAAVADLPFVSVTEKQGIRFCNGGALALDRLNPLKTPKDGELYRVRQGERFLGLGRMNLNKEELAIQCVIAERTEG